MTSHSVPRMICPVEGIVAINGRFLRSQCEKKFGPLLGMCFPDMLSVIPDGVPIFLSIRGPNICKVGIEHRGGWGGW